MSITYLGWKYLGAVGIVVCAPLIGITFAKPIIESFGEAHRLIRALVYRGVDGRYYSFKGTSISIVEDGENYRWLRATDVRKIIEHLPRDKSLLDLFGSNALSKGEAHDLWIKAEALRLYLAKSTSMNSIKFKMWIEREVIFPSEKLRGVNSSTARNDTNSGTAP